MKNKTSYLVITSIFVVVLLYVSDQVLTMSYLNKIGIKAIIFTVFPVIYILRTGDNIVNESIRNFTIKKTNGKNRNISLLLGLFVFTVIIAAYAILHQYIDTSKLITEFQDKYKINSANIIGYSVYLVFINSFLEEFFFRGFIFLNLKKLGKTKLAYLFSSFLFAVYHIANFQNWFHIMVFILAIAGLVVGACIFNYLDDKEETFLNSWFVHICADIAIVLIGFRIFGLI